jgi:hypothetical protein
LNAGIGQMHLHKIDDDPAIIGLTALGWIITDQTRADRLLALTGLTPDDLRTRAAEPAVLAAVLTFLEGHQPDLVACAASIGSTPEALVRAREGLDA